VPLRPEDITGIFKKRTKPLSFEEIARLLRLQKRELKSLKKLLNELLKRGDLIKTRKGHYAPPEESLKQARYSTENVGHFGLASKCYTHFTSPIRRYPDLVVHRILRDVLINRLNDKRLKELEELLPFIAFHSSKMERVADEAEKTVIDAMRVWFMKDKVGDEFKGIVISITPFGMRIRLKDFYVEGFLHVSYMTDDFYLYNDQTLTLRGKRSGRIFRIGDEVIVRIDRIDDIEREIIFGLA
jgi:ribonuclease R